MGRGPRRTMRASERATERTGSPNRGGRRYGASSYLPLFLPHGRELRSRGITRATVRDGESLRHPLRAPSAVLRSPRVPRFAVTSLPSDAPRSCLFRDENTL